MKDKLSKIYMEILSKEATAEDYIKDFVASKDPRFEGKSKEQRIQMALGAYYGRNKDKSNKQPEKEVKESYIQEENQNEYPLHSDSDFRAGTTIPHKNYRITFKPPSQRNMEKEGKSDVIRGIHPSHKDTLEKEAGMNTSIGHTVEATIQDNRNGNITTHHIFQSKGIAPMSSIASIGNNPHNDEHREEIKNALTRPLEKE